MRTHSLLLALATIATASACGDDGGGGSHPNRPSIDADANSICDQIAKVSCYNLYQCCTEGEIENYLNVSDPRTYAECLDDVTRKCDRQIAPLEDALTNNRVDFDADSFNTCLTAVLAPADSCTSIGETVPWAMACMTADFSGLVAAGGQCFESEDCQGYETGDAFCTAARACQAGVGNGMPCDANDPCTHDLYCGRVGVETTNTCHPRMPENGQCTSDATCETGLFCDFQNDVCAKRHATGEACTGNPTCESGDCIPGKCSGVYSETCYADSDCYYGSCSNTGSQCYVTDTHACGYGMCSLSHFSCYDTTYCDPTTYPGDTCTNVPTCVPSQCTGSVTCAPAHITVDYCEDALGNLPL